MWIEASVPCLYLTGMAHDLVFSSCNSSVSRFNTVLIQRYSFANLGYSEWLFESLLPSYQLKAARRFSSELWHFHLEKCCSLDIFSYIDTNLQISSFCRWSVKKSLYVGVFVAGMNAIRSSSDQFPVKLRHLQSVFSQTQVYLMSHLQHSKKTR